MKLQITYSDGSKRVVSVSDDEVLALAARAADYEDMVVREKAKLQAMSVIAA